MTEIPTFPPRDSSGRIPLTLTLVVAVAAGMAGAALLFWLFPSLRRAEILPGTQSVIVPSPGTVIVEEGTRVSDVQRQTERLVGRIFRSASAIKIGGRALYPEEAAAGAATLLTSDGWFATVAGAGLRAGDIVEFDGERFTVDRIVADTATPFVLGKISNGRFPAAVFAANEKLSVGMTVITHSGREQAVRNSLVSLDTPLAAAVAERSSDRLTRALAVMPEVQDHNGAPVFSLAGELVGLTASMDSAASVVLPSSHLRRLLDGVLRKDAPTRPLFGVSYVLADVELRGKRERLPVISELIKPAATAGLKVGDIIVGIDRLTSPESVDLFSVIGERYPGDEVVIRYVDKMDDSSILEKTITLIELSSGG